MVGASLGVSGARVCRAPTGLGGCLRRLGLGAADAGGLVAGVLLVRVGLTAEGEFPARVLPRLALAIPMETKLGQLLADFGGGLLLERDPHPLANHFREPVGSGKLRVQKI